MLHSILSFGMYRTVLLLSIISGSRGSAISPSVFYSSKFVETLPLNNVERVRLKLWLLLKSVWATHIQPLGKGSQNLPGPVLW